MTGSPPEGAEAHGTTAAGPGRRTISSAPAGPSGNPAVSTSTPTTAPAEARPVPPGPTPPVTTRTGAKPRGYSAAAWSSRDRNTGEGRPLYWAAPSTTIAAAVVAWSRAAVTATASTTAAQPKASDTARTAAAPSERRSVQKAMRGIYDGQSDGRAVSDSTSS